MRNHYEGYKCTKRAEKVKKNNNKKKSPTQPSKQKVNYFYFNPCTLLEAGFHAIHTVIPKDQAWSSLLEASAFFH